MRQAVKPGAVLRALVPHILLLVVAFLCLPAGAVTIEEVERSLERNRRVYDFAGVLPQQDSQRIREQLARMEQQGLAEGAVIIVDRLENGTIEEYALQIGEAWKIGRRDVDNGFVILVSMRDRKWRAEIGRDLQGTLPDVTVNRILRNELVPALRQQRYGEGFAGVLEAFHTRLERAGGVEALPVRSPERGPSPFFGFLTFLLGTGTVLLAFRAWPRGSTPGTDSTRLPTILIGFGALGTAVLAASQGRDGLSAMVFFALLPGTYAAFRTLEGTWTPVHLDNVDAVRNRFSLAYWAALVVGTLVLLVGFRSTWALGFLVLGVPLGFALRGYFQRVPRKCPECAGALRWLPENEEAQFLRDEENLEQSLGSVDYDIWRCAACNRSAVFGHHHAATQYTNCPRCHRHTLTRRSVVDQQPNAWTAGTISDITECRNPACGYQDIQRRDLPPRGGGGYRDYDDGFNRGPGIIIIPPIFGGGWGGGHHGGHSSGDAGGGFDVGGIDIGDFGGGGGFDGGGASGDW